MRPSPVAGIFICKRSKGTLYHTERPFEIPLCRGRRPQRLTTMIAVFVRTQKSSFDLSFSKKL